MIKKYLYSAFWPRLIVLGVLGLMISGCPLMMAPMMVGMGSHDNQHQEQKKEPHSSTADRSPGSHDSQHQE